jgi:hypothetical protein
MAHLFKTPGAREESRDFNRQFRAMENTADLYYGALPYNGNYARHVMAGCESMRHGRSPSRLVRTHFYRRLTLDQRAP